MTRAAASAAAAVVAASLPLLLLPPPSSSCGAVPPSSSASAAAAAFAMPWKRRGGGGGGGAFSSAAFGPRSGGCGGGARATTTTTSLRDIDGWRDVPFDCAGGGGGTEGGPPPREVCVLPFPFTDVLLQGETKELRLYEDRFLRLFEDCRSNHRGVLAMGLMAEGGVVQTVPLCEVEAFSRMEGLGIFLTIRAVGRASLLELTQQEPYVKAVCVEIADGVPPSLELPRVAAGNIENFIAGISALEHRLDDDMDSRIRRARLEDAFRSDDAEEDDDNAYGSRDHDDQDREDDDDDDDDDEEDRSLDRSARFRAAFEAAKAADTQGYTVSPASDARWGSTMSPGTARSAQDLTAISWAAFCTDAPLDTHGQPPVRYVIVDEDGNEVEVDALEGEEGEELFPLGALTAKDVAYRIKALDCTNLFERLKLASFMLRERRAMLQSRLEERGLGGGEKKRKGEDK